MAKGWESKSVEDQIIEAEGQRDLQQKPTLNAAERERLSRKQSLLLSKSRTAALLKAARNERYVTQLKRTLAHLDEELQALEAVGGKSERS